MMRILSKLPAIFLAVFVAGQGALADDGAGDSGTDAKAIVLEVTYSDGSGRDPVQMSMQDLQDLPRAGFETTTIWTEGTQHFEGVWLRDLAAHLDMREGLLELIALNEYLIDIEVAEIDASEALIAYLRNGEPMSVRDKGPLWMVFPYDSDPKFRTETVFARSIWQLDRLNLVLPQ